MNNCYCQYEEGDTSLPDGFDPKSKLLVCRNLNIKRADYYDKTVTDLLTWNGELKDEDDIKNYRQW